MLGVFQRLSMFVNLAILCCTHRVEYLSLLLITYVSRCVCNVCVCNQVSYCLSNAMLCICIGQNIKSRTSVRPSGVCGQECDVICGPLLPNLERRFPIPYRSQLFVCSSIGSTIRACASFNRPSLTAVKCLHQRFT